MWCFCRGQYLKLRHCFRSVITEMTGGCNCYCRLLTLTIILTLFLDQTFAMTGGYRIVHACWRLHKQTTPPPLGAPASLTDLGTCPPLHFMHSFPCFPFPLFVPPLLNPFIFPTLLSIPSPSLLPFPSFPFRTFHP